ncbi:MAG: dihydrodipicolinate reductase [Acidobacteriia bacterium]|nr:dihydrodipicolinate reductase [Terriglobia bacterium]
MKIALLGYGKMGKLVETLARQEGWEIGPRLDIHNNAGGRGITKAAMEKVNVAIDFSQPDAVLPNVEAAARLGINLVVGTTGWLSDLEKVEGLIREAGIGMVYGSNFSVGMNLFFEIVARAAQLIGTLPQYDPFLAEQHHQAKKDSPSGTALKLQAILAAHFPNRTLAVACTRSGFIPGNHQVGFDSEADTILLEHRVRSRQGFAEGAILAAKWVSDKKGLYDFHSVFTQILEI